MDIVLCCFPLLVDCISINEYRFALHKGMFRDTLCYIMGGTPQVFHLTCACSKDFTVNHAMNCPTGGYPTIRHNELRNFTAALLSEECHDISIESYLQPLTGEQFSLASVNVEDGARLDVAARGFWGSHHCSVSLSTVVLNSRDW